MTAGRPGSRRGALGLRRGLDVDGDVHAIGDGATELIHIGQAVMAHHGLVDYFVDTVFNYPTLAECYRVAALDGINQMPRPWAPQP